MGPDGREADAPPACAQPTDALRRLKSGMLEELPQLLQPQTGPIAEETAPQTLELTYPEEAVAQPRARSRSPRRGDDPASSCAALGGPAPGSK